MTTDTQTRATTVRVCTHQPPCPRADATDHDAAVVVAIDPGAGCHLLCNGVVVFDDGGELDPQGHATPAHRGPALHRS